MHKIIAVLLIVSWISFIFFKDSEYVVYLSWLSGACIGSASVYLWRYHALWDNLFEYLGINKEKR
jgi:hypothetical protein